jgi:hypothetical protein
VVRREFERKFQTVLLVENARNFLENSFGTTYIGSGSVALECAGVDLDICTKSINSSALEVACPPPGIRAKI